MTTKSSKSKAELLAEIERLKKIVDNDPFKGLFDSAPLPYQSLDKEGKILAVNKAWLELLGYAEDEVLGRWFGDFLSPGSVELLHDRFHKFLSTGTVSQVEYTMVKQDGTMILASFDGKIGYDDAGDFRQTHCVLHDITDKRKAEEEIRQSETRFRGLFQSSIDGILYTDMSGSILEVNPAFCSMVGQEESDLLGKNVFDLTPREWHETEKEMIKGPVRTNGYSEEFEKEFIHRDGRVVPVAARIWLNRSEGGQALGTWGICRDLSAQKSAEKEVARTAEQYRLLAENAEDVIWSVDNDFNYLYISPSVERLRGFTPEEVMQGNLGQAMAEESFRIEKQIYADAIKAEVQRKPDMVSRLELEILHKDGSTLWVEIVARALRDDDGNRIGFVGATRDVSERKEVQQQVLENERMLRTLLNATTESVAMFDLDGTVLTINHTAATFLGSTVQEMLGKNIADFLPDEVAEKRILNLKKVIETKETISMRDVQAGRIFDSVVYPVLNESGEVTNTAVYAKDVTESLLNQEALKQSEAQYKRIVETANEGIFGLDLQDRLTYANQIAADFLGYKVDEIVGSPIKAHFLPEDIEGHGERIARRKAGERERYQRRFVRKDGKVVWGLVSATPLLAEDGSQLGSFAMISDITDVKESEALLRESETRFRRIVETANEGIISVDSEETISFLNKTMADIVGYTEEELLGQPLSMIVLSEDRSDLDKRLERRMRGESEQFERRYRKKDGSEIWVLVSATPIMGEDGEYLGALGMVTDITERKRAEDALKLTQYSVDKASIDIFWFNEQGQFVYANEQTSQSLGYTREELLELNVADINPEFHHEDWPEYWNNRRTYVINQFETVHQRKDGTNFPVGVTSHYRNYGGRELLFCYSYDLSERARTDEKLRRSQSLLNEVQRISLTGGWEVDMVTGETHWTEGQYQLHGLEPDEVKADIRLFFEEYVHPDDRKRLSSGWSAVLHEQVPVEMEYRSIRADGSEATFVGVAIPDVDENGNVQRVYGSTRDVTMERQAAEELERAHERLLTILDGIDADIYVSAIDSHEILFMNEHMREHFGSPIDGAKCHEAFRDEDEQCVFCPKPTLLDEQGNPVETIIGERYNPLTERWYLNHDRAIQWLEGDLVHMHMAADITELKDMEKDLKQAMAVAEAASLAKNEFLANMSHEIRTPLNGLLGMLQILQLTNLVPEQLDYLDTAINSGRNLLQILNDILDLSKIESGKLELEEYEFELGEVLESVVGVYRHQAESRGLKMSWAVDESLQRHFIGDKGRLRQILFNLVGNAAKFTDAGSVVVEAYPMPTPTAEGKVLIFFSVADTGIGIPDDKMDQIFDPFTQVDGSFTRKYQGTGLGLGIVRRLVKLMGGTIAVAGKEGEGATIVFTVAAKPAENVEVSQTVVMPEQKAVSWKILVVEDERVNRTVVERLLSKIGHEATCVESGEVALEILKEHQDFDCILMDIQMPGLNGLETTREIRSALQIDVPVIALTAHAMKGDRTAFLEAGMNGYVAKPFELTELEAELKRVLHEPVQ